MRSRDETPDCVSPPLAPTSSPSRQEIQSSLLSASVLNGQAAVELLLQHLSARPNVGTAAHALQRCAGVPAMARRFGVVGSVFDCGVQRYRWRRYSDRNRRHAGRWHLSSDVADDHVRGAIGSVSDVHGRRSVFHDDLLLVESCRSVPTAHAAPTSACDGQSCLAAIDYCTSAVGPSDACRCFSKASDCFQNCTSTDVEPKFRRQTGSVMSTAGAPCAVETVQ